MLFDILVEEVMKEKGSLLIMAEEIYRRVKQKQLKVIIGLELIEDLLKHITNKEDKREVLRMVSELRKAI